MGFQRDDPGISGTWGGRSTKAGQGAGRGQGLRRSRVWSLGGPCGQRSNPTSPGSTEPHGCPQVHAGPLWSQKAPRPLNSVLARKRLFCSQRGTAQAHLSLQTTSPEVFLDLRPEFSSRRGRMDPKKVPRDERPLVQASPNFLFYEYSFIFSFSKETVESPEEKNIKPLQS